MGQVTPSLALFGAQEGALAVRREAHAALDCISPGNHDPEEATPKKNAVCTKMLSQRRLSQ